MHDGSCRIKDAPPAITNARPEASACPTFYRGVWNSTLIRPAVLNLRTWCTRQIFADETPPEIYATLLDDGVHQVAVAQLPAGCLATAQ
jgi:hypothetical protein